MNQFTVERFDANQPEKGWVVFMRPERVALANEVYHREVRFENQGRAQYGRTEHAALYQCSYRVRVHPTGHEPYVLVGPSDPALAGS